VTRTASLANEPKGWISRKKAAVARCRGPTCDPQSFKLGDRRVNKWLISTSHAAIGRRKLQKTRPRTYASLRSNLVSSDQLRNWQIVLKKSGDGRKFSGTLTRVARGDGGADDDYCCPGRNGIGARDCALASVGGPMHSGIGCVWRRSPRQPNPQSDTVQSNA
jgi:hypothetical protein